MIDYATTKTGDILRIVGAGAPGYAAVGDLVRVRQVQRNGVTVEDRHGLAADFLFGCGAARLEPTEWRDDFPGALTARDEASGAACATSSSARTAGAAAEDVAAEIRRRQSEVSS